MCLYEIINAELNENKPCAMYQVGHFLQQSISRDSGMVDCTCQAER